MKSRKKKGEGQIIIQPSGNFSMAHTTTFSLHTPFPSVSSPLDGLQVKVFFLSRDVVGTHDPSLESGGYNTREDTTESVEASFVSRGNHLGDVHH